jgi:hypothetical protein
MPYQKINGKWTKVAGTSIKLTSYNQKNKQIENLLKIAEKSNLSDIVKPKTPKLSFLQRLGSFANITNPTGAITHTIKGEESFGTAYLKDIGQRITETTTGKVYDKTIPEGKDLAETLGIKNKIAKFGLGLSADIILDPSTYLGGWALKGAGKALKVAAKGGVKVAEKIAPKAVEGTKVITTGLKDAFGKAFKAGYKTTPGLVENVVENEYKVGKALEGIHGRYNTEITTGVLSRVDEDKIFDAFVKQKRTIIGEQAKVESNLIDEFNKISSVKIKTPQQAKELIPILETKAQKETKAIQNVIEGLQKGITKNETSDLVKIIKDLRRQLGKTTEVKTVAGKVPDYSDVSRAVKSTINLKRTELKGLIGELEAKLKYGKKLAKESPETIVKVQKTFSQKIVELNQKLVQTQNKVATQRKLLEGITNARTIARGRKEVMPIIEGVASQTPYKPAIEFLAQRGQKMGEVLVQSGKLAESTPYKYYVPFLKKEENIEKFLSGIRRFKTGTEGYIKQFKGLLKDDDMIRGFEAFAKREMQVTKDLMHQKQLRELVAKFGKKFNSELEAKAAEFVPITSKGYIGKMGEVLGYVSKYDADFLTGMLGDKFGTIDAIAKATGFDAITSLFKRSVTGLFAPFHIRNWVSGTIQNYEKLGPHALSPKMMATGMRIGKNILRNKSFGDETIELGEKLYKLEDLKLMVEKRFFGGSYIADLGDATALHTIRGKIISKQSLGKTVKTLGLSTEGIPFRAARKIGEFIETQQKATAFATALDLGRDTKTALTLAKEAGFDYRLLTAFESKIMRRIIPFYAWNRFNIGLQIDTLLKNPQRVQSIMKVFQNLGDTASTSERESLPEYLANGFGMLMEIQFIYLLLALQ